MKYITSFETTEAYNAATLDLPNVSLIEETMSVSYKPWVETRLICKYTVTDTSHPTTLFGSANNFSLMSIDGEEKEVGNSYTFDTTGEHTVLFTLADGVTTIGGGVFTSCSTLTSVTIPDSVTSIGSSAFAGSRLTSIIIPDSVTSIGSSAFAYCSRLTSIIIPDSVTSIGTGAFQNCSELTSIIIPDSVTSIGMGAFQNCSGLTSVTIGNSVIYIDNAIFQGCSGLTSVTIPDSVTSIGMGAFDDCSGLTSVTIGNSVTSINMGAFSDCSALTSITCNATTAPTIQNNTFQNINTNGILTVPTGSNGYDAWMGTGDYYLGKYNWTKVEQ